MASCLSRIGKHNLTSNFLKMQSYLWPVAVKPHTTVYIHCILLILTAPLSPCPLIRNKRKRSQESGNITNEASDEPNYDSIDTNTRRGGAPRARKQTKKNTELKNFYRFQIKEEKIKDLDNLRKKFAEDRERVAKMKEQRKFKPF